MNCKIINRIWLTSAFAVLTMVGVGAPLPAMARSGAVSRGVTSPTTQEVAYRVVIGTPSARLFDVDVQGLSGHPIEIHQSHGGWFIDLSLEALAANPDHVTVTASVTNPAAKSSDKNYVPPSSKATLLLARGSSRSAPLGDWTITVTRLAEPSE